MKNMPATAAEFDARFDAGEDMGEFFKRSSAITDEVAQALLTRIDAIALRTGTTRADLINRWLTEKLDQAA